MKKIIILFSFLLAGDLLMAQHDISNPFFDQTAFRGAFDASNDWTDTWTTWDAENTNYPATTVTKSGEITANETWTSTNVYKLEGFVYVRTGVTLTIEAGTIIRGDKSSKGSLIIERSAKIHAVGTAANPIVFTSNEAAGSRDYGDWGGIIICGNATINVAGGEAQIEGGPTSYYGGAASPNDADNSGELQYVRIEFPGIPFVTDKEINGLTLGGVGSATTIDHIQVYRSGDDAFEWFGGTVNAKYLVSAFTWDDDFDTDYGYLGMVQYAVALRDSAIADPGSGSNGFESDNDGSGSANTPQTHPIFCNVSMFGPKVTPASSINTNYKRAMHLRRNSAIEIHNAIFGGYKDGLLIDGSASEANATGDLLKVNHVSLAGTSNIDLLVNTGSTFDIVTWFSTAIKENDTLTSNDDLMISDPFNYANPDFRPLSGSPVLNNGIWAGIENQSQKLLESINIYPVPAMNVLHVGFTLASAETVKCSIVDMQGRQMESVVENFEAGNQEISFNVSALNSGVYFISISTETSKTSIRFIK